MRTYPPIFAFPLLLIAVMGLTSFALADNLPIDFHQTVLPILKDSCFACHVAGADTAYASKDPAVEKMIKRESLNGVNDFPMSDQFPFADKDPATKQLEHLEKELSRSFMPPHAQDKLGLGLSLSDKNRQVLLEWVAQEQKKAK